MLVIYPCIIIINTHTHTHTSAPDSRDHPGAHHHRHGRQR